MHRKILFLIAFFLLFFAKAQESPRFGISGRLQSEQLGILFPIWIAEKVVVAPAFGARIASEVGKEFSFGLVPRYYFKKEKLSPYVGLSLGLISYFYSAALQPDNKTLDGIAGLAVGGEYFFDSHFSMGVEAQGNFSFSDTESIRFGNPGGTNFNTATAIHATVYF